MNVRSIRMALLFALLATVVFTGCVTSTADFGGGYGFYGGGLLITVLNLYAIYRIIMSGASSSGKALWVIVILIAPVLGFIIWVVAGPK